MNNIPMPMETDSPRYLVQPRDRGNKEDEDNKDEQYEYKEDLTSDMEQKLLVIQGAHTSTPR